jgi:putative glycosyltransferase (TIGR04372 family)
MDHLIAPFGRTPILLVDVAASPEGHGIGYGIMLKRIQRVLLCGQMLGMRVFYVRRATAINSVVFVLQSESVTVFPQWGPVSGVLRLLWHLCGPFRLGAPRVWTGRLLAWLVLEQMYMRVERWAGAPRVIRRAVLRPWPAYRALKNARAEYGRLAARRWKVLVKRATARARALETAGVDTGLHLSLPPALAREAEARARLAGIDPDRPLVTLHVRESGYRAGAGLRQRQWDLLRNARIDTYRDACRALAARGYTVVRLGDPSMTPVGADGLVDLAHSAHRSEALEAWCVLRSEFMIGCDSGPSWLAVLAGVPVLTVNAVHLRDIERPVDRFICKRVRDRRTGGTLSIAEMLTVEYMRAGLDAERFEHVDNEPGDIADAVIDMADAVRGDEAASPAQERFNQQLESLGRDMPHDWSGLEGIAFARRPRGRLSRRFADRYVQP